MKIEKSTTHREKAENTTKQRMPVASRLLPGEPRADFRAVAQLHIQGIPEGFLSSLGTGFLARLYRGIAGDKDGVCYVVRDTMGRVTGFVAGTADRRSLFRRVLRNGFFPLFFSLLPGAVRPRMLARCLETVQYGLMSGKSDPKNAGRQDRPAAELLAIVVDRQCARSGAGRNLVGALDNWMQNRGVMRYLVVTAAEDSVSNAFYRSCGFVRQRELTHHGNRLTEYGKSVKRGLHARSQG